MRLDKVEEGINMSPSQLLVAPDVVEGTCVAPVLADEIGHVLTNRDRDVFSVNGTPAEVNTNPSYVFYPGAAWLDGQDEPIGRDTWEGPRRMTYETGVRARTIRPAGDLTALSSRLLTPVGEVGRDNR